MDVFRIVFLCTGNQARSVIAEECVRRATTGLPVEVSSAGMLDLGPSPPLPEAVAAAARFGLDVSAHRSRSYTSIDFGRADLVVGFEREHVAIAAVEGGADPSRAFVLKELSRLLGGLSPPDRERSSDEARAVISKIDGMRKTAPFVGGDDIEDPAGRAPLVFDRVTTEVVRHCRVLVRFLFGVRVEPVETHIQGAIDDDGKRTRRKPFR